MENDFVFFSKGFVILSCISLAFGFQLTGPVLLLLCIGLIFRFSHLSVMQFIS